MGLFKKSSTIVVREPNGQSIDIYEASADEEILPGDMIAETATGVEQVDSDNAIGRLLIAIEDQTPDIAAIRAGVDAADAPYAAGELVYFISPPRGTWVQVRATAAVTKGATLATKGATTPGQLAAITPDATTIVGAVKGVALEAQATADTRFNMEVA